MSTVTTDQGIVIPIGADAADNPQAFIDMIAGVESRLVLRYTDLANRTALHTAPVENQITGLATEDRFETYNGTQYVSLAKRSHNAFIPRNAASAPINNSIVLVSDAILTTPVTPTGAGSVYLFTGMLYYECATAADIRLAFSIPAGSMRWNGWGLSLAGTTTTEAVRNVCTTGSGVASSWGGAGVGTIVTLRFDGWANLTAAGNLTVQYAQSTADASNLIVHEASWLKVTKMT